MRGITARAREVARERNCALYRVEIERKHLNPPGTSIDIGGPLSDERVEELLALLHRWMAERDA